MRIWVAWYDNWSNSKKSGSYKNLDSNWRKRIIPDWGHSSDRRKYMEGEKNYLAWEKEYEKEWLSKKQTRKDMIQEWINDYYDLIEDETNPDEFKVLINWKLIDLLEYDNNEESNNKLNVETFDAGRFGLLAKSPNATKNQIEKDEFFFKILQNWWKISLQQPEYKLNSRSVLNVTGTKWNMESMPAWVFLKYLWYDSSSRKIKYNFSLIFEKYWIEWNQNTSFTQWNNYGYNNSNFAIAV